MNPSEHPTFDGPERHIAPTILFDYRDVIEAFLDHSIPDDSIAYIGDAVVNWDVGLPSWHKVLDIRRAMQGLDSSADQEAAVGQLLAQAEELQTTYHWDQATEVQAESNAILAQHPGLFYLETAGLDERVAIKKLLISSDRTNPADLFVLVDGCTVNAQVGRLAVAVDIAKLTDAERTAVEAYAAALEIQPHL